MTGAHPQPYLPESGDEGFHVEHYDLDLDYRVATNRLSGTAVIQAVAVRRIGGIRLDLVGLRVSKVTLGGERVTWRQDRAKLAIDLPRPLAAGDGFSLTVSYAGTPKPRRSAWGEVGWEELSDGVLVAAQPNGAPTWFPCNDRPADKAAYRIAITTESTHRAVAGGVLVERSTRSSRTRWVFEAREPMASYLATVQIGRYRETELAASGGPRQVAFHPVEATREVTRAFARQARMMQLFERVFGPYPFAEYAVVVADDELEIPLEAQALSVFGRNHLTAASERLIAHELAHSWFGNSLTASSWQHIWLHEGFACYAEWLWSEECGGPTVDRLAAQHSAYLAGLPQDLLVGDPGPAAMFDDRVYKRGALTLHAVRRMLGDEPFFAMLVAWVADHRHGLVDTDRFVRHAGSYSSDPGRVDITVDEWLFAPRLPKLPAPIRRR